MYPSTGDHKFGLKIWVVQEKKVVALSPWLRENGALSFSFTLSFSQNHIYNQISSNNQHSPSLVTGPNAEQKDYGDRHTKNLQEDQTYKPKKKEEME